ncbi:MAG: DUF1761 domain-containing protein [Bacteroidota bacterium]
MKTLKINYLAVVVAAIVSYAISAIWYTVFGEPWMAYNKLTLEFVEANISVTPYIVALVNSFVFAFVMAWILKRMNVKSAIDGLKIGFVMGISFALLLTMTTNFFSYRPYELSWIDGGVNWLIFAVVGLILGAWRKYE